MRDGVVLVSHVASKGTSKLNTEWLLPFVSGVAATILGFVLTIVWDVRKTRAESLVRDRTVMKAVNEELVSNKWCLQQNLIRLHHELPVLDQNKTLVQPLFTMKTGFWYLAMINLPGILLAGDRLVRLRSLAILSEQVNDEVRSRENYRIHNTAMSDYAARMKMYDELLVRTLHLLDEEIAAYEDDQKKSATEGGILHRQFGRWRSNETNGA